MSNSKCELSVIRSRFQPFTTFHASIIEHEVELGKQVALCMIRDYETITRWHRMFPNVGDVDLRHLPIFNPFTSWEVCSHVQSSLRKRKLNSHIIPVIILPLKFSELIGVLATGGKEAPSDLAKFIKKYPCDRKTYDDCKIKEDLGKIISIISYDAMPPKFDFAWLFGMFDLEDERDANLANDHSPLVKKHRFFDELPKYPLEIPRLNLGLYGQFILWIYLQFVQSYLYKESCWQHKWPIEGPGQLLDLTFLTQEIQKLTKVLKSYLVDENEWEAYNSKVTTLLAELLQRFDNIPKSERDILLNYSKFIELARTSIQACRD